MDIREARREFPATDALAYINTAAVGLASRTLTAAYHHFVDEWSESGLDYARGEAADEALVFVDGSQFVGALPVAEHLPAVDVLSTADHKFLVHAGRGLGYCYLSRENPGSNPTDERRVEGRARPGREFLRADDGSLAYGVTLRDTQAAPLLARLKQQGIVGAARDGNLRLSVHFYNHEDDIERLANALK